jgi:hypothetical protein
MDRWKTIAMMSVAFTCGVAYTAAGGGADSAMADDSADGFDPLPAGSSGGARAVLYLVYATDGTESTKDRGSERTVSDCCPPGFTSVGVRTETYRHLNLVCLEDA